MRVRSLPPTCVKCTPLSTMGLGFIVRDAVDRQVICMRAWAACAPAQLPHAGQHVGRAVVVAAANPHGEVAPHTQGTKVCARHVERTCVSARAAHAPAQVPHGVQHARRAVLVRRRKAQVVVRAQVQALPRGARQPQRPASKGAHVSRELGAAWRTAVAVTWTRGSSSASWWLSAAPDCKQAQVHVLLCSCPCAVHHAP